MKDRITAIYSGCTNAGPTSEEQIEEVEKRLSVVLPESYKSFLRELGASTGFPPYEIAGIFKHDNPDEPPMWTDLVEDVERSRKVSRGYIQDSYIPFTSDGMGSTVYLDTSRMKDGECPVVALGPGLKEGDLTSSFIDFVEEAKTSDPLERMSQPGSPYNSGQSLRD